MEREDRDRGTRSGTPRSFEVKFPGWEVPYKVRSGWSPEEETLKYVPGTPVVRSYYIRSQETSVGEKWRESMPT